MWGNCREVVALCVGLGSPCPPGGMPWGEREAGLGGEGVVRDFRCGEPKSAIKLSVQPPPAFSDVKGLASFHPLSGVFQEGAEGSCPPNALPQVGLGGFLSLGADSPPPGAVLEQAGPLYGRVRWGEKPAAASTQKQVDFVAGAGPFLLSQVRHGSLISAA